MATWSSGCSKGLRHRSDSEGWRLGCRCSTTEALPRHCLAAQLFSLLCFLVCSLQNECCSHWLHPTQPLQKAETKSTKAVFQNSRFSFYIWTQHNSSPLWSNKHWTLPGLKINLLFFNIKAQTCFKTLMTVSSSVSSSLSGCWISARVTRSVKKTWLLLL